MKECTELLALYNALDSSRRPAVITDSFQVCRGWDKFNGINLSSVMSFLIKEAGRLCDYYASDIFYDLKEMHTELLGQRLFDHDEYHWVVGIREMGCDHDNFILVRCKEGGNLSATYRAMYELEILLDKAYDSSCWFSMNLYPIDLYRLGRNFKETYAELEEI